MTESTPAETPLGHTVLSTLDRPLDDKEYLHRCLRGVRNVMVWKLEGSATPTSGGR